MAPWPFVRFAAVRATKISIHCKNVNVAEPNGYIRDARGKFSMKRKLEWKLNVSTAINRRVRDFWKKGIHCQWSSNRRIQASGWQNVVYSGNNNENYGSFEIRARFGRWAALSNLLAFASRYLRFLYNFSTFNMQYLSFVTGNECFFAFKIFSRVQFT